MPATLIRLNKWEPWEVLDDLSGATNWSTIKGLSKEKGTFFTHHFATTLYKHENMYLQVLKC